MKSKELQSQLEYIKYSRNEIHGYSKGVQKLFDLAVSYIYDAEKAHQEGRKALWSWGFWEAPLLYACDTIPVSFTELGRLGSLDTLTVAEDYYQIPTEACSMVKATLGEWHLRSDGPIKRILGSSSACEPYNMAWELMKKQGFDVHCIDTVYRPPSCSDERYEEMVRFFVDELHRVARWLTGGDPDEERVGSEIRRRNVLMQKVRRILELRLNHPLYIRSLPMMFLITGVGHYFGKPEEYGEALDLLIEELESARPDSGKGKGPVPLLWTGGRGQEFGVYKAVDDAGGALLGWVLPVPYARDYREDLPPVEAIARYFLDGQTAGASIFRRRAIEEQVKKTDARGIVMYGYVGCSFGGIERELEREHFHKQGVPSISLEGSFQVGPPSGQLLTRIRAFVEMLS